MYGPVFPWGGRRLIFTDQTSAPSAAGDGNFQAGDWVVTTAPSAGNPPGWVCVTGGPGGTAVFKAMANLQA